MVAMNLSHALRNTRFQASITVIRRKQVMTDGRMSTQNNEYKTRGIVTAASGNDLQRLGDVQVQGKAISIVTRFLLRGQSSSRKSGETYQPDIVKYRGDQFLVVLAEDYSAYGEGWVQAIATSLDYIDQAPH